MAVVGENGIGKSTFLRTLSGVQPALQGKIFIRNKDLTHLPSQKLAELISVVLTDQPISKNLSVAELVALGRQPYTNWIGRMTTNDKHQIKEALQLVGIEDLQQRKCFELSDGQLQKVLIARTLAQNTPLVILDEPTSHLDMYHKAQVLKLLKQLSSQTHKAILFATHEINLALQLCDQIIMMQKDNIKQGTPEELISQNVFESMFPSDLIVFDRQTNSFRIKS